MVEIKEAVDLKIHSLYLCPDTLQYFIFFASAEGYYPIQASL
jgi:hypothetical protein